MMDSPISNAQGLFDRDSLQLTKIFKKLKTYV